MSAPLNAEHLKLRPAHTGIQYMVMNGQINGINGEWLSE